jgi:hypothetical protein
MVRRISDNGLDFRGFGSVHSFVQIGEKFEADFLVPIQRGF